MLNGTRLDLPIVRDAVKSAEAIGDADEQTELDF
jgi:hypothetical protein